MSKFRKKPVVIDAVQFDGTNYKECEKFLEGNYDNTSNEPNVITLEGYKPVHHGYWIIKGVNGEFYPCDPDVFKKTYEPVKSGMEKLADGFADALDTKTEL